MMQRQPIESSNLADAAHDPATGVLEVTFKNGKRWRYFDVSAETFSEFMGADSQGSYFARNIRGSYHGEFVSDEADNDEGDDDGDLPPEAA